MDSDDDFVDEYLDDDDESKGEEEGLGTGYLGKNVYGADETSYVRLINVTEYAFMSFCSPSDIESLHSIQGSSDIRDWAPGRGKTIGLYYSLNNTVNDGDAVTDLSGKGHHGTAVGF